MVLIYTQNWEGKFKKVSFELVSYGVALAKEMNSEAVAVSIGKVANEELKSLAKYGVSKIISLSDDKLSTLDNKLYSKAISEVAQNLGAKIIVFAHNNEGKAIAPRIAANHKAALVTAVNSLAESLNPFIISKAVFTGKAIAKVKIHSDIKVFTLFPNSFGLFENPTDAPIEEMKIDVPASTTKVLDQTKSTGKVLLTDADIVVSGGRGMKSPDNWKPIEDLAELLGAGTACSRPVSDEGWRPHSEHVGQTGKIIAPNLYFAFGISGAIQHLGGVSNSKIIVAVNTDKDAPIFEAADYGIIGDVQKFIPEIIEEIKKIKA